MGNAKKRDGEFLSSAQKNDASFMKYFYQLAQISMSRFEYHNLPPTIDPVFMERQLFFRGGVCWFEDEVLGLLALPFAGGGPLNPYHYPYTRDIYSDGYNARRTAKDSVIMYDNMFRTNIAPIITGYCERLMECDRTVDVNIKAQKTPIFIQCEESQRLSMLNVYQKYDGNQPVIFGDKKFNLDGIKVLKTDAPFVADRIHQIKSDIWNEVLSLLGVPNVQVNKKERLISDEVSRSMGGTFASRFAVLDCRRMAVEQVNQMFGTNISVDFRTFDDLELTVDGGDYRRDEVPEDE